MFDFLDDDPIDEEPVLAVEPAIVEQELDEEPQSDEVRQQFEEMKHTLGATNESVNQTLAESKDTLLKGMPLIYCL